MPTKDIFMDLWKYDPLQIKSNGNSNELCVFKGGADIPEVLTLEDAVAKCMDAVKWQKMDEGDVKELFVCYEVAPKYQYMVKRLIFKLNNLYDENMKLIAGDSKGNDGAALINDDNDDTSDDEEPVKIKHKKKKSKKRGRKYGKNKIDLRSKPYSKVLKKLVKCVKHCKDNDKRYVKYQFRAYVGASKFKASIFDIHYDDVCDSLDYEAAIELDIDFYFIGASNGRTLTFMSGKQEIAPAVKKRVKLSNMVDLSNDNDVAFIIDNNNNNNSNNGGVEESDKDGVKDSKEKPGEVAPDVGEMPEPGSREPTPPNQASK